MLTLPRNKTSLYSPGLGDIKNSAQLCPFLLKNNRSRSLFHGIDRFDALRNLGSSNWRKEQLSEGSVAQGWQVSGSTSHSESVMGLEPAQI